MIVSRTVAVVLSLALLSGCATTQPAVTPPPTPVAAQTPSPTPTPTPSRPALNELVLTTEGLGELVPGDAMPEVDPAVSIVRFDENACLESPGPSGPGRWVSAYPGGDGESFYLFYVDDAVYRVMITSPLILTDRGIGLGSDEAALKAAYPEAKMGRDDEWVTLYYVTGDKGTLTFEVSREQDDPAFGTVTFMTVMKNTAEEPWAISNTGAGATCGD